MLAAGELPVGVATPAVKGYPVTTLFNVAVVYFVAGYKVMRGVISPIGVASMVSSDAQVVGNTSVNPLGVEVRGDPRLSNP